MEAALDDSVEAVGQKMDQQTVVSRSQIETLPKSQNTETLSDIMSLLLRDVDGGLT